MNMIKNGKKVAILSRSFAKATDEPLKYLSENGYTYRLCRNSKPQDTNLIISLIQDADAIIVGSDVIDRSVMDHCQNLKVISKHGVGLDSIDLELAKERGIVVTTTFDANSESVADFTVMLMLAVIRNLKNVMLNDSTPNWATKELTHDLFEKTVGLIGYGKIGRSTAKRLEGFGVKILVADPKMTQKDITTDKTYLCDREELLAVSDIVSLHLPLLESTKGIMNRKTFECMKKGAILINTARGGLINMRDLEEALKNGRLSGAGLDVYPQEPPVNEPVICLPNVVATPHIAPHTVEANYRMGMAAVKNVVTTLKKME